MKLTSITRNNLKDIVSEYERLGKKADKIFYEAALETLKREDKFYWNYHYEIDDTNKTSEGASMCDGTMYFSMPTLVEKCPYLAETWKEYYNDGEMKYLANLYALYVTLHESSHLWQCLGLFDDKEINRLYRDMYEKSGKLNLLQLLKYVRKPLNYSFERHANIDAFRELSLIYKDSKLHDVPEFSHIHSIEGIEDKVTPLEQTLKYLKLKDKYDFTDVSFEDKISLGVPMDEAIKREIDNNLILFARDEVGYTKTLENIYNIPNKRM